MIDPVFGPDSVSCASTAFCAAVGYEGAVATYHSGSWSDPETVGMATTFESVSCPTTTFCVAVAQTGDASTYNGSTWSTPTSTPAGGGLYSVSCSSATLCVAIDGEGEVMTFNGSTWTQPEPVTGSHGFQRVSCVVGSPAFCLALGATGAFYNGSKWMPTENADPVTPEVQSISCGSPTLCASVDASGEVSTFNGTTWGPAIEIDSNHVTGAVACSSSTLCLMMDVNGEVSTYDGASWSAPAPGDLYGFIDAISCAPNSSFCLAAEDYGNAVTYNAGGWGEQLGMGGSGGMGGLSCPASTFCVATDLHGRDLTYNGTSWDEPTTIDNAGGLSTVSCPTLGFCMALDWSGQAVSYSAGGWGAPADVDEVRRFTAVSCASRWFCVGVDSSGYEVTYDGEWRAPEKVDSVDLTAVSCPSASFCVATDARGRIVSYVDGAWREPEDIDGDEWLSSVSCAGPRFCVAVDNAGNAVRDEGEKWDAPEAVTRNEHEQSPLFSVSCPTIGTCRAFAEEVFGSFVVSFAAGRWSAPETDSPEQPDAVSCPSQAFCGLLGELGNAAMYTTGATILPASGTTPPTINGVPVSGQTLTEAHAVWTNNPSEYSYQWLRCDAAGNSCRAIAGAEGTTYTLTGADEGATIRVEETAKNEAGTGEPAVSRATAVVSGTEAANGPGDGSTGDGAGAGDSGSPAKTAQTGPSRSLPPEPVLARSETLETAGGKVTIRLPGASRFVALSAATSIPDGSEVEATSGRALVTEATPSGPETAEVTGGRFRLEQSSTGAEATRFILSLPLTGCARVTLPRGSAAAVASHGKHGPKSRHLWVSEHGGAWGTNGRYVSTTVEGTRWLTQDECDQSEVLVAAGKVQVHDLVRDKTKSLTAGQRYTARER